MVINWNSWLNSWSILFYIKFALIISSRDPSVYNRGFSLHPIFYFLFFFTSYFLICTKILEFQSLMWSLGSMNDSTVKNPPAMQEMQKTQIPSLGLDDPLQEEMATHSSILAWKILQTEEPGGLQSMERAGHSWETNTFIFIKLEGCWESNCDFCTVEICHLIVEYILNKCC